MLLFEHSRAYGVFAVYKCVVDRSGLTRFEQRPKTPGVILPKGETIDSVLINVYFAPQRSRPELGHSTSLFVRIGQDSVAIHSVILNFLYF